MGIFSRVVKNPYGSVSLAPPPAQVTDTAESAQDLANTLSTQYQDMADKWPQTLQGVDAAYSDALLNYPNLINAAEARAEDWAGLFQQAREPMLQTMKEAGMAGSATRQDEAASRAGSAVEDAYASELGRMRRQNAAMGIGTDYGSMASPAAKALAQASAMESARQQERAYGEQVRRSMFPILAETGDRALQAETDQVNARANKANLLAQQALLPAQVAQGYLPLAQTSLSGQNAAQNMYGNAWNAGNSYSGLQSMYDQNAYNNFMGNYANNMGYMQGQGFSAGNPFTDALIASVPYGGLIAPMWNTVGGLSQGNLGAAGGALGGLLGMGAGPLGSLAGSKVGSWLGSQAKNWWDNSRPEEKRMDSDDYWLSGGRSSGGSGGSGGLWDGLKSFGSNLFGGGSKSNPSSSSSPSYSYSKPTSKTSPGSNYGSGSYGSWWN